MFKEVAYWHNAVHCYDSCLTCLTDATVFKSYMSRYARKPTFRLRELEVQSTGGQRYRVMIPETEYPQEAKSVCPGQPARHAQADPSPHCLFSRGTDYAKNMTAQIAYISLNINLYSNHVNCLNNYIQHFIFECNCYYSRRSRSTNIRCFFELRFFFCTYYIIHASFVFTVCVVLRECIRWLFVLSKAKR